MSIRNKYLKVLTVAVCVVSAPKESWSTEPDVDVNTLNAVLRSILNTEINSDLKRMKIYAEYHKCFSEKFAHGSSSLCAEAAFNALGKLSARRVEQYQAEKKRLPRPVHPEH